MQNEPDTGALLLAVALEVAQALLTLAVAGLALVLTLANWRPTPAAAQAPAPARPMHHPLAGIATELECLPAATLRTMAGVRSKGHRKAALVEMLACC